MYVISIITCSKKSLSVYMVISNSPLVVFNLVIQDMLGHCASWVLYRLCSSMTYIDWEHHSGIDYRNCPIVISLMCMTYMS